MIWDFAGNLWEWTSYFNDEEKPSPNTNAWYEYTQPVVGTSTMPLTDLIPTNGLKSFWNDTWDSAQSIGMYYPGNDASGGALHRGGFWNDGIEGGVFAVRLNSDAVNPRIDIGFRCAIAVP